MKKAVAMFCAVLFCVALTSCDPGTYKFDDNELENNIVRVELINYENSVQKEFISWVPDHSSDLLPFIPSNATVLEKLNEEKIPDFLSQLSESEILDKYYAYNSPKDICLRLTYNDGNFIIIWCNYHEKSYNGYIGEYTSDGRVLNFIGSFSSYDSFESLVNDFFETDLNNE